MKYPHFYDLATYIVTALTNCLFSIWLISGWLYFSKFKYFWPDQFNFSPSGVQTKASALQYIYVETGLELDCQCTYQQWVKDGT